MSLTRVIFDHRSYAYVEFANEEAVEAAVALSESEFKGRQVKVSVT